MRSERLAPGLWLRPAIDADSAGIIAVIERAYQDYPGCDLHVDLEEPGLRSPARAFDAFWVLVENGRVVGTSAAGLASEHLEIKKVYLDQEFRSRGLERLELWSDSRFELGHRVYESLGFVRTGRERRLDDLSNTLEYHYERAT